MHAASPAPQTATAAQEGTATVPALQGAPAVGLPLRFLGTGLLALAALPVLLWMRPEILATYHYNQYVIAATHLVVLGWVGSVVFGALYQLVPVVLETRLYSERLARWHFLCHLIGFAGMVWMFWEWNLKQVGHFGSVLALGAGLCIYNLVRTLARAPRRSWITFTVASALFWLAATLTVGLGIAAAKCTYESAARLSPASPLGALVHALEATATYLKRFDQIGLMHAHAHLGVVGAYVVLLIGVSYKLVPMFALSPTPHAGRAWGSLVLLNLAVPGSFFTILHRSDAKLFFTVLGVAGVALYGWELIRLLRRRRRPVLDLPLRYFLTGLAWLGGACGLALYLSWPGLALTPRVGQLENLYGLWGLLGALSFCLLGMLYKILPFLVWYRRYGPWIGRQPVPALHELYASGLLRAGFGLHGLALLGLSAATLLGHAASVRYGAVLLAAAVACHLINAGRMLGHLRRPVPAAVPAGTSLSSMPS
jgi:hypothetical protein